VAQRLANVHEFLARTLRLLDEAVPRMKRTPVALA